MKFTARELGQSSCEEKPIDEEACFDVKAVTASNLPVNTVDKTITGRTIVHIKGLGYWVCPQGICVSCKLYTTTFFINHAKFSHRINIATRKINERRFNAAISEVLDILLDEAGMITLYNLGRWPGNVPIIGANESIILNSSKALRMIDPTIPAVVRRNTKQNKSFQKDLAELTELGKAWQEKMMGAIKTTKERAMVIHDTLPFDYTG